MRTLRRTRAAVATLAATALAIGGLSACQGNANDTSTGGGTLTIQGDSGNPTLVRNFNPYQPATMLRGVYLMYEPLEIASSVDGTFTPYIATDHKFVNPTTLQFTIRSGEKWSDGKALTPQDVKFSFDMLKKYPALDTTGVWAQMASDSLSGNTFTVTFKSPNVPFASVVAEVPIVPQHLWASVADPTKYANPNPVGSGPFALDKFAPTQYQLKRNTSYWNASKIAPKSVVYPAQSTNQSTNQLDVTSGKFDWSYQYLPSVKTTFVARDSKHNQYWFPPGGAISLFLNLTKAPYSDVNFRQGVSYALNRTTIAQKAVNGYLTGASSSGLILPNLQDFLDPSLPDKGNVTQDLAKAKAAFARAGYTERGGKLVGSDGKAAAMTLVMPSNYSDWVAAGKEIVNELGAIGIKVTLDLPQAAQYTNEIQSGNFDAAFGGFGGTGNVYNDFNNMLNSSFATPIKTPTTNNFERFKDPAVDADLSALAAAVSTDAQKQAAYKLQQVMYNQVPLIPLYYGGSWGLFSTKHFTGWPSSSAPYNLPTSYNYAVLDVVSRLKSA